MEPAIVRDVVVVVPGIMGSELVARDGRPLWSVSAGSLAASIRALRRGELVLPNRIGDEAAGDGVEPTRLLDTLHVIPGLWSPVTGYDGLWQFLRGPRFRLIEERLQNASVIPNLIAFPYDWRLSNRYNGRRLARVALAALQRWRKQPGMAEAKLVLLCHSMGGLVARWFAEREGGAEHIRSLVTIGTPHRGALKALATLVNGLEPRIGPLRVSLSEFARSLPSLYQLLPQYDCIVNESTAPGAPKRIGLSAAQGQLTRLDPKMLADAGAFHAAINAGDARARPYKLLKIVGIRQPTLTTARIAGERVEPLATIDGVDNGGDGTVPRLAAEPVAGRGDEVHEVANQHGELQGVGSVLEHMDGIVTREQVIWQSAEAEAQGIGVALEELWCSGEEPELRVTGMGDRRLHVQLFDEAQRALGDPEPVAADGRVRLPPLREGGYRVVIEGKAAGVAPVGKGFLVLDGEE